MDSKKIKQISISIIIILILAGLIFLTGIIINSSKGAASTRLSFSDITQKISSYADDYGILTENFLEKSESSLSKQEYLNAITIKKDNIVFYAYPLSSNLLKADENGNAYISNSSPLNKVYSKDITLLNGDTLNFTVAYNTILPNQIYQIGRITFIIILACFILTIIAISYFSYKESKYKNNNENKEKDENLIDINEVPDISNDIVLKNDYIDEDIEIDYEENNLEHFSYTEPETEDNIHLTESITIEKDFDNKEYYTKDDLNSVETIEPKFTERNDPLGLFSGITGFGWENHLEPRLDSELVRATSSEQDVSLFIITLPELNKRSQAAEEIYQVILDFFKYRDMIFEYKDHSFAGIHLNMNLENAINYAEQLFINLYSIYESYGLTTKIGIGITTRSMRLVPGSRLITEAEQAAKKALEEETMPIVAFKVNHEKYREYVSEEA